MKKKLSSVFVFSFLAANSFGQASIKGKVMDRQQNLPFATVLLLDPDSAFVNGVLTNSEGEFIFEHVARGYYLISSSMVGYTNFYSLPILVAEKNIVAPDIILQEASTELDELVIKAEKPLFEQQIDRLVMNVQSSITSSGNTILELLQKSPGVVVNKQNNTITMNGKSGVRVMINNKIMQLPLDVVVQMLDGMTSSNVDKIELITTPSAKYDSEGNAGIIHIVTKENINFGTNGSVGLTLGAHWAETLGGNLNLNHRSTKFAYFVDYSVLKNHNLHTSNLNRNSLNNDFAQTVNAYSHRENVTNQQNLSAGFEWRLSDNTALNILFSGYRRNWDVNAIANDISYQAKDSTVITNMNIHESNMWQSATVSMGLQTKINAKSEISFNLDYLNYYNDNPSSYDDKLFYQEHNMHEVSKIDLQKTTPIRFLIARADYQYSLSPSLTIETGFKGVASSLDNNVLVQRFANNLWIVDTSFTSYSTLNEQIGAGYVSTKWQAGKQWQVSSGLRYEYTHTSISSPTQENLINRKYGYFFPSASVKKELGNEKDFQFSYTRRITRPTYNDIAPYVFFWGPNTFSAGNTSLWPAISDAIKAGYHKKQWIISLQLSHSKNEINSYQPENDVQSSSLIYRSQNLSYLNTIGLTNSYSYNIVSWWELQGTLTTQYQTMQTSHLSTNVRFSLYGLNMNLISVLKLPKDFAIEISGFYQSKLLAGIAQYHPQGSLNAGIQKKFKENGVLKFSVDDILNTNYWRIKTYLPQNNLDTSFTYDFHNQFFRLTYSRNLGNRKLGPVKYKSGSEEEKGRVNN